jgi:rubrerythrin
MTDAAPGIRLEKLTEKDALDLAILIEEEAHDRYVELARLVGGRYAGDAADVFRLMAMNEAKHGAQLSERRQQLFDAAPRTVTRDMIYEVEAPGLGAPRVFMSARQAMEVALVSEQKAREFFDEALRYVRDPGVAELFTELRAEEVLHEGYVRGKLEQLPEGPDVEEDEADEPGTDPGG